MDETNGTTPSPTDRRTRETGSRHERYHSLDGSERPVDLGVFDRSAKFDRSANHVVFDRPADPEVSIVVPARNEERYLPASLASLAAVETGRSYEVIVVDGNSDDRTRDIARSSGARLVEGTDRSIADGRNRGARRANGTWLCFVDADTVVRPAYVDEMIDLVTDESIVGASSRCRMHGWRSIPMQWTINRLFPRLRRPILPGFNLVVSRETFERVGGFPDVPNEDTAFSRVLAREGRLVYHPDVLVETSARRIFESGLAGTIYHYLRLDFHRLRREY